MKKHNIRPLAALLAERKWILALIFFTVLFNPLFYFRADNIIPITRFSNWLACLATGGALAVFSLYLRSRGGKIYAGILFLLSLAPNLIVWSYLYLSNLYLRRDMFWVIFGSYTSEAKEYVQHFAVPEQYAAVALYAGFGLFCILKIRHARKLPPGRYKGLAAAAALTLVTVAGFQYLSQAVPTIEFYKSYLLFGIENRKFQQEIAHRRLLEADVKSLLPDTANHVFVILIGESTSICHMSLYGYFRRTTPRMDARAGELDVFLDVVTPDTHTIGTLQKALTFADHLHPEYYHRKASVVELFNDAGFETYWISNQVFLSKWGGSYGVIASQAEHVYDLSAANQPDGVVIPVFRDILSDGCKGNKVIFIHLMGSHHIYDFRYPDDFAYFDHRETHDLPDAGFRTEPMKATIDAYDNSIRYGDFVYDSLLEALEETDASSWLLFFSDHGEEVFDTRKSSGHHMSNVYPCQSQIPFVLWRSERYRRENPRIVIDPSRPYSTEQVIHSISTLSGLSYHDYDPSQSLFTTAYIAPQTRKVGEEDYQHILKKVSGRQKRGME
jgi:heptose-I-phosphate ethanolaminephosphotransferase